MAKTILFGILSLTLTLNSYLALAATPDVQRTQPDAAEVIARLDDLLQSFDRLRAQVDRSQFDLGALLERLEYDAEEIIRFVKEEVYFEQYPGVLRGAKGTLMSRSGSALDQALLLATLLKDAGYEARIVRGEISALDARTLLNRMQTPAYLSPLRDADAFAEIVAQLDFSGSSLSAQAILQPLLETGERRQQAIREEYAADARRISTRLLEEMKEARGSETQEDNLPVAEARDYFWVQSRLDNRTWIDLHPAWADERAGPPSASVTATFSEEVPTSLVQKVELLLTGERVIGRKRETVTLLKMEPTPAANLIGVPLSLMFVPLGEFKTLEALAEALPNTQLFAPVLNQTPGDYVVDLRGHFVPAAEAQSSMAGVFAETARATSEAAGALGALGKAAEEVPRSVLALTGLWLDFRMHLPDGQVREYRRTIFDRISGDRDADHWSIDHHSADQLRDLILGVRHTLLETGHGSPALKLDQSLSYANQLAELYRHHLATEAGMRGSSEPEVPPLAPPFMHLALFDVFDRIRGEDPSAVSYRSVPSLVTIEFKGHTSENGDVTPQTTVDVVSNERRVYLKRGETFVPSVEDAVYLGVMETLAEGSVLPPGESVLWNAGRTTLAALEGQRSFTVIKPDSREAIAGLQISPISARAMRKELEQGYWIVAPELAVDARQEEYVWWRIHPETGNALGMIHTGQGAAATEGAVVKIVGFMTYMAFIAAVVCIPLAAGVYAATADVAKAKGPAGTCLKVGAGFTGMVIGLASGAGIYAPFVFGVSMLLLVVF